MNPGALTRMWVVAFIATAAQTHRVSAAPPAWFRSQIEHVPPIESPHRRASNSISVWTVNFVLRDGPHSPEPLELVVARKGHVLYRLHDGPFYWKFALLDGGSRLAIEHGPRHNVMSYDLIETVSRKVVETYSTDSPRAVPAWVHDLTSDELK